jgi:hypothetical protein
VFIFFFFFFFFFFGFVLLGLIYRLSHGTDFMGFW